MTRPAPAVDPDPAREPLDLIYRLGDRPPLGEACLVGFQHVLAVFVGIVTPPLIIGGALGLDIADVSTLVSMSLLISGIATFIQTRRIIPTALVRAAGAPSMDVAVQVPEDGL